MVFTNMAIEKIDLFKDNLTKILASELPYTVVIQRGIGYSKYYDWLESTLGPKWVFAQRSGRWNILTRRDVDKDSEYNYNYVVYFKHEADATLFALRWL